MTEDELKAFEEHKERFRVLGRAVYAATYAKSVLEKYPQTTPANADELGGLKFDEMWARDHKQSTETISQLAIAFVVCQKKSFPVKEMPDDVWEKWYDEMDAVKQTATKAYVDFSAILGNTCLGVSAHGGPTELLFVASLPKLPKTAEEAIALMATYGNVMASAQKKG